MKPLDSGYLIRRSWVALLLLLVLAYALFQSRFLIFGPNITIERPTGRASGESLMEVSGSASNASGLWLNDRPIFMDEGGRFTERLLLSYGYNILTVRAEDRFGRSEQEIIEVVYK